MTTKHDAFTNEIIQSYLSATVKEMMTTTIRTSYSVIFAEGEDFTCGLLDTEGRLTFQEAGLGIHAGSFPDAMQVVLNRFESFAPGDVIIHNDPYMGGAHQADVAVFRPIYAGGKMLAFAANRGHWADIGGMAAGGWAGSAHHVIQEALLIPPVKLYREGVVDRQIKDFVLSNVRIPQQAWGTLQGQIASLIVAERRVGTIVDKYGLDAVEQATEDYLQYARTRFLKGLQQIPNGRWSAEEFMDDDGITEGPHRYFVTLEKQDDRIIADFTGSDPQATGPANVTFPGTKSAVYVACLAIIDPFLPVNSGWFDLIQVRAPTATVVNPQYPAPVFHSTGAPAIRVNEVCLRAFAQAVPDRAVAASYGSGTAFIVYFRDPNTATESVWMHYGGGGCGARSTKDGLDAEWFLLGNSKNEAMEIHENRFPVIYEYQKLRKDAGGPGQFRGGRGVEKRVQILAEGIATELNDRHTTSPWGLFGGRPGASNRHLIIRDGQTTTFPKLFGVRSPSKFDNVRLVEGDISIFGTGGGGGYGDPLGRDYERVRADVENGAISVEGAEKDYGTVIGNDGRVDVDASEVIREARRKEQK